MWKIGRRKRKHNLSVYILVQHVPSYRMVQHYFQYSHAGQVCWAEGRAGEAR